MKFVVEVSDEWVPFKTWFELSRLYITDYEGRGVDVLLIEEVPE